MLSSFLLTYLAVVSNTTAICPEVKIINRTDTWTKQDQKTLESTYQGCIRNYSPKHCPVEFYKTEERTYRVVCGIRNDKKDNR